MNWSYVLETHAGERPNKEAIIFEDRRITYGELSKRVNALAKGLLDSGIKRGDVVALLLYNCPEFVEMGFAANKIGAIWLPMNFRLAGEELAYILNHADVKMLISEADFSATIDGIKDKLPLIKEYIAVGKTVPRGWKSYDDFFKKNPGIKVPDAEVELDDLERLMYTSGTTAHPKGVMITYGNFHWKNLSHAVYFGVTPNDKTLMPAPLYHVAYDISATTVLYIGGTVILTRRFDPIEFLKSLQKEKATLAVLVPVMINMLIQEPTFKKYDVSSLKTIIDGGEKIPTPVLEKIPEFFPGVWFSRGYGLTETVSGDTFLTKDTPKEKMVSDGKPVPMMRMRIVDDNERDVPPRTLGEILLKGPKVFKGYWKDPKATADAIKNGWFHTGDIGYIDEDGYLYIEDRKKDMIISGGENIASAEIERVVYEMPEVLECAVIPIPHPKWLEVPKAFVVLKPGQTLTEQEIIEHCQKSLAKFKVPKEVEFIPQLPRNPSGKVLKRELRKKTG